MEEPAAGCGPGSTGRPVHLPLGEQVDVKVGHGLAGVGAVVHDQAEALGEIQFLRHHARHEEQVAEDGVVSRGGEADAGNELFGYDEQMDRSLRLDVVEYDTVFVLVLDLGGDFAVDDALKDGFGHTI